MNTSKLTAREFYQLVLDATRDSDAEDYQLMYDYALKEISKLDARKAKPSKEKLESAARRQLVLNYFQTAGATLVADRDAIASALGITPGQATTALSALAKEEQLIKIDGKGKTKTCYQLAV